MEARRQQAASAAVAAAAAGDVNLPSGLLVDFERSILFASGKLKEFDEEEKAGEPLGYRKRTQKNRMRGWSESDLPQHIMEWRTNLLLAAVVHWFEDGDRRSLENARNAASWDAAAIREMRSQIAGPGGECAIFAPHVDSLVLRFGESRGEKNAQVKVWSRSRVAVLSA